jgi:hypothetical protein
MQEQDSKESNIGDETAAQPTPITPDPSQDAGVSEASQTSDPASDTPPGEDESSGQQMPDPVTLMAMAAMHVPTQDLVQTLITVFDAHAWRAMGLVTDHTGEVKKDLPSAQLAIDCLAFLLGKIEPTLNETEKRDMQRRLMDLRTNYLAKMRES